MVKYIEIYFKEGIEMLQFIQRNNINIFEIKSNIFIISISHFK
jgi:hypothetical protein